MTIILDGSLGVTTPSQGGVVASEYINSVTGFKNRLINGHMQVAQRGTSATVVAGTAVPTISAGFPCVDRWFVYSTGANVTAAQVAGSGNVKNRLQITGAASVTAVGVGQRIEQNNSIDLAGSTCTLSVDIANSLLTAVTWTASYATTTANTFGTIGTPTKTQIATGTFTVNSTVTNYQASFAVPSAATTGIEILFTVGSQTSGTWTLGAVQFEKSAVATSYDFRDYGRELSMCQRYCEVYTYPNSILNYLFIHTYYIAGNYYYEELFRQPKLIIPVFILVSGAWNASPSSIGISVDRFITLGTGNNYLTGTAGQVGVAFIAEIP
jgi:hypothetical protein